MGAVADGGGGHACTVGPSRTGPRKGTAPLMPPTCTLGSPLCFWAVAECTAGTGLLGHPPQQRPECWHQGVEPAQGKAWAAGRRPRLLGSWSTVPPQGPRCEVGAPGPPGALCLPTHSSPLPGRGCPSHGQMWPAPPNTHISALLVPDTSRKKGGHGGREGGLSPEKGHCPLWESEPTCLYIVGPAAGLPTLGPWPGPSHVAADGPLLRPAWYAVTQSRTHTRPLCQAGRAGLRLTGDFPSWFGGGPAPWQETANIVH